jgi:hypothetical protein
MKFFFSIFFLFWQPKKLQELVFFQVDGGNCGLQFLHFDAQKTSDDLQIGKKQLKPQRFQPETKSY